ncbi:Eukaryotic translation initiation factor 5B like protein [Argiope bruennichi]|uniref:Eukaryotic translation initiation factor 5B n=1 Tax=Argiope bruennichi TaxID=94029 RepID=A0A8T0FR71_ARGBR|nr:Eukaryotic translation initiation factor 5B like protein [Argiope bruennichi]
MGKDKKQKKSRDDKEKFDDGDDISTTIESKIEKNQKNEVKSLKNGKEKSDLPTLSDEESEIEIITLEQQGKKKKKTKQKKANFSLLEIEGDDVNSEEEKSVKEQSPESVEMEDSKSNSKSKEKSGKKSKKKERKKKEDDDEDLDKLLEELKLEAGGKAPAKTTSTEAVDAIPKPEEKSEKLEEKTEVTKKSKKKKKAEEVTTLAEEKEQPEGEGDAGENESSTVKTAAQKKKEKKEKEKQKKQAQFDQSAKKKKPDAKPKEESPAPGDDQKEKDDEKKDDEVDESESKKKKKKKGKDDEEEKKDKKRPGKKMIAAMQEALKKAKEEEERLRQEEEAKIRAEEEAERLRLEKLRLEQERKEKKKQKEKEKRERLRAEGKLLTKSQKQNRARMEATLAALREQGIEVPQIGEKKEPRPRLGDRKKPAKKKSISREVSTEPAETEEPASKETSPQLEEEEEKKEPEPPAVPPKEEEEDVKDAWDETSSSEDEDTTKPEMKKVEIVTKSSSKQAANKNESDEDEESESETGESSSEEESESEEESYSSSDSDDDNLPSVEKIKNRIQKRRELAESNRSMDKLRSPVVCVLGHVDTGKTKILDKIRSSNVQDHEAGGITQKMVPKMFPEIDLKVPGLLIIDTPGHESFSNLRSRGSSLCDIAILVVDITHGLEPQTIESINMLKQRKTPFVVALNKIDRVYEWKTTKNKDVQDIIKSQSRTTKQFFEDRVKQVILEFANQSLNAVLYYENPDPRQYISMVPTSALTGEGMGNLMALIVELTQSMMAKRLMFSEELQATILEVKAISGLGHTMDTILVNGRLREGDTIVFAGYDGPVCSQIRSLLMPQPLKELRIKTQFVEHREVEGAQGVKICGKDFDKAIAGLPLLVPKRPDETKVLMEEVAETFRDTMNSIKVTGTGVYVQTSTLGSLEALMEFLTESKIPVSGVRIGPVTKKDVMKASAMLEHDPTYAVILAFDVRIEREAQELADSLNIKIFHANIIYHLFDAFVKYRTEIKEKNREMYKNAAVFPCKLKILPQFIFNSRDPIVVGVSVEAGVLKEGTPLCVPTKEFLDVGIVTTIEVNHKPIEFARKGQEVCIKIEPLGGESPKMYGRHFDHTDLLVSKISRHSIDMCKEHFREDLQKTDWQLMVELKKLFQIM